MKFRSVVYTLTLLISIALVGDDAAAAERVWVRVQSGRRFYGSIHPRTDRQRLWLQWRASRTTVLRPIDWSHVVAATHRDRELTAEAFRTLAFTLVDNEETDAGYGEDDPLEGLSPAGGIVPAAEVYPMPVAAFGYVEAPASFRIATFEIDAAPANWDFDAATDGLLVWLTALDNRGCQRPFAGSVEAELWSRERDNPRITPSRGAAPLVRIGRWSQPVDNHEFTPRGVRLRLPFSFDTSAVAYHGILKLRIIIPGQGVYHRVAEGIRIQPW